MIKYLTFACHIAALACMYGVGSTLVAWQNNLPRAYPGKFYPLVFGGYLLGVVVFATAVGAGL